MGSQNRLFGPLILSFLADSQRGDAASYEPLVTHHTQVLLSLSEFEIGKSVVSACDTPPGMVVFNGREYLSRKAMSQSSLSLPSG